MTDEERPRDLIPGSGRRGGSKSLDSVVSVRFPGPVAARIRELAAADGDRLSDWIRDAAQRKAEGAYRPRVHVDFNDLDPSGRFWVQAIDADRPLRLSETVSLYDGEGNEARGLVVGIGSDGSATVEMAAHSFRSPPPLPITGWSCPHVTITSLPGVLGKPTVSWCGCDMQPVYANAA